MRIAQVTCPACGASVFSKNMDLIVRCDRCGELHIREAIPRAIDYEVGELRRQGTGNKVYIPVWSMDVVFHIVDVENKHDLMFLWGLLNDGIEKEGKIRLYLPAHSLDAPMLWGMATRLTEKPPHTGPEKLNPRVRRLPCIISTGMAEKLAHFLFIATIADKRGVLQRMDYRLTVINVRLIYLLDYTGNGTESAVDQERPY